MSTTHDRMVALVNELNLSEMAFEKEVGLGAGFVNRVTRNVYKKSLDKIKARFPRVNVGWIKSGYGEMFTQCDNTKELPTCTDRLIDFCEHKGMSKFDFEVATGCPHGFLTAKKHSLRNSSIIKIKKAFPELNMDWVLFGDGEMISNEKLNEEILDSISYKDRLRDFCSSLGISETVFLRHCGFRKQTIMSMKPRLSQKDLEKIKAAYPQINTYWVKTGKEDRYDKDVRIKITTKIIQIPLVPSKAYAGYLCGYADTTYMSSLPMIPFITEGDDEYVAFEVSGDSMDDGTADAYKDGDTIICKVCPSYYIKDMMLPIKKKDFVIVHNDGILLKTIKSIDNTTGEMTLSSLNPNYIELTVNLQDVRQLLSVEFQQRNRTK